MSAMVSKSPARRPGYLPPQRGRPVALRPRISPGLPFRGCLVLLGIDRAVAGLERVAPSVPITARAGLIAGLRPNVRGAGTGRRGRRPHLLVRVPGRARPHFVPPRKTVPPAQPSPGAASGANEMGEVTRGERQPASYMILLIGKRTQGRVPSRLEPVSHTPNSLQPTRLLRVVLDLPTETPDVLRDGRRVLPVAR